MSLLSILYYPNQNLRKIAKPVIEINDIIRKTIDNMLETMYVNKGIGLAAPQVNLHQQIITIDISDTKNQPIVLINPVFLQKSHDVIYTYEGCLSLPNQYDCIARSKIVKIVAYDYYGTHKILEAEDLLSVCIQHEMDHLVGKLFLDYLSSLKRQRIHKKMEKFHRFLDLEYHKIYK